MYAMCAGVILSSAAAAIAANDDPLLQIRVAGPNGTAVKQAEAFLVDVAYGLPITRTWTSAEGDFITIPADNISRYYEDETIEGDVRLVVRAPGHAWSVEQVSCPVDETVEVTLDPGRRVTLRFETSDGGELPDGFEPVVYTEPLGAPTWLTCVQGFELRRDDPHTAFLASRPDAQGHGVFVVHVPNDVETVSVLVDHPGYLRVFEHGPIDVTALADGVATIALPQPVTLNVDLSPREGAPADYVSCGVGISHSPTSPDGWSFRVNARYGALPTFHTTYDDLAPGAYSVEGFTGTKKTRNDTERPDYCLANGYADLTGEATATVNLHLETYDEAYWKEKLRGDYTLTLDLDLNDGTPAVGKLYEVSFSLRPFRKNLEISSGTVPEDGLITLTDLPPGQEATIVVMVNDKYVDQIYLRGDERERTMTYALAPDVGDRAPDFEFTSLASDTTHRLADLKGQVVFLEFWATWCGPCQEPMMHNNELIKRRGDSWRDRVTVLGVSIDDKIETIREHVDERDWNAVRQVWVPEAWQSAPVKMYAVTGVPSAFLIDAEGVIVWAGHPNEIELEARIDEMLTVR